MSTIYGFAESVLIWILDASSPMKWIIILSSLLLIAGSVEAAREMRRAVTSRPSAPNARAGHYTDPLVRSPLIFFGFVAISLLISLCWLGLLAVMVTSPAAKEAAEAAESSFGEMFRRGQAPAMIVLPFVGIGASAVAIYLRLKLKP